MSESPPAIAVPKWNVTYSTHVTFVTFIHIVFGAEARSKVCCMPHKYLMKEFEDFARSSSSAEELMRHVSQRIHAHIPRYNWAGFYLVDKKDATSLVLGPHTGSFSPAEKISFATGLCGAVASMGRTIVADDVAQDPRYVQASDMVKSQIAAPILDGRRVLGVFNVESYFMATFKAPEERAFVEACANLVGKLLETTVSHELARV